MEFWETAAAAAVGSLVAIGAAAIVRALLVDLWRRKTALGRFEDWAQGTVEDALRDAERTGTFPPKS